MIIMNIKIKEALGLMITIIIKMNSDFKSNQSFLEAFQEMLKENNRQMKINLMESQVQN